MAAAGDVDADGFAHAMVGAPSSGRDSGGMLSTFLLEDSNRVPGHWSVHSATTAEELPWLDAPFVGFGSAVAPLGPSQGAAERSDYYDFAVGAAGAGRVYLVGISTTVDGSSGRVPPPRERHGTIAPASVGLAEDGLASGFGTVAEAVPDRDGDGYPELMLCGKNDAGVGLCSLVFVDPLYRDGVEAVKSHTILDATLGFGSAAAVVPPAHLVGHPEPLLDDPSALAIAVVAEDGATLRILAFDAANAEVGVWELDVETAFADPAFAAIRPPSLAAAGWGCSISALPPVSGADPRTLDFVVGAEHYRDRGAVFGISLSLLDDGGLAMTDASTVSLDFAVNTWTGQARGFNTPGAGDRFGRAVAVMSDLDSDGGPDLIVGAPGTGCCGAYYQVFLRHGPDATAQCAQDRIDTRRSDDDDQRDDENYAASPVPTLAPPTGGFFGFAVFIGVSQSRSGRPPAPAHDGYLAPRSSAAAASSRCAARITETSGRAGANGPRSSLRSAIKTPRPSTRAVGPSGSRRLSSRRFRHQCTSRSPRRKVRTKTAARSAWLSSSLGRRSSRSRARTSSTAVASTSGSRGGPSVRCARGPSSPLVLRRWRRRLRAEVRACRRRAGGVETWRWSRCRCSRRGRRSRVSSRRRLRSSSCTRRRAARDGFRRPAEGRGLRPFLRILARQRERHRGGDSNNADDSLARRPICLFTRLTLPRAA